MDTGREIINFFNTIFQIYDHVVKLRSPVVELYSKAVEFYYHFGFDRFFEVFLIWLQGLWEYLYYIY